MISDEEKIRRMSSNNEFDGEFTRKYKYAYDNQIPVKFTYTENGEIKSFMQLINEIIDNESIEDEYKLKVIYKKILNINNKVTADDIQFLYSETYLQFGDVDENNAEDMETIIAIVDNINNFLLLNYEETVEVDNTPPIPQDEYIFKNKRVFWLQMYEKLLNNDRILYNKICISQFELSKLRPEEYEQPKILNHNISYHPKIILNENELISPTYEDGMDIFNHSIATKYIPIIHYTNEYKQSYIKTYYDKNEGESNIEIIKPDLTPKINTIKFYIWLGKEDSSFKNTGFKDVVYNLDTNRVVFKTEVENGGIEQIRKRFSLSFPMLNLDNSKIISIGGFFTIPKLTIDIPIFHNFLLTSSIASNYLVVDERKKSLADNPQFIINYNSYNIEGEYDEDDDEDDEDNYTKIISTVSIYFNTEINITENVGYTDNNSIFVTIKKARDERNLTQFLSVFMRLISLYKSEREKIGNLILQILPEFKNSAIYAKSGKNVSSNTKNFKEIMHSKNKRLAEFLPDVYSKSGASRSCQKDNQPAVIPEDDVEVWSNYDGGRIAKLFPPPGKELNYERVWLVCPNSKHKHIGMVENKGTNSDVYRYLPCCKAKEDFDKYPNYWGEEVVTPKETKITSSIYVNVSKTPLGDGKIGNIPVSLSDLLQRKNSETADSYKRCGVQKSNSSFLHAVLSALMDIDYLNSRDKEEYVINLRSEIANAINPEICKQELFDSDNEIIRESMINPNVVLDPYIFYRYIEEFFGINIFVFTYEGVSHEIKGLEQNSKNSNIEIPRCKINHIRIRNQNPCIIIIKSEFSKNGMIHCEYVRRDPDSDLSDTKSTTGSVVSMQSSRSSSVRSNAQLTIKRGKERLVKRGYESQSVSKFETDDVRNKLFNLVFESFHCLHWNFSNNYIENRDNPFSRKNWSEHLLNLGFELESQHIDDYGKLRYLNCLYKNIKLTIEIPIYQPLNLQSTNTKYYANKKEIKEIFGDPTEETNEGLWYSAIDFSKGVFIPTLDINQQKINMSHNRYVKRNCDILLQLIIWAWKNDPIVRKTSTTDENGEHMKKWWLKYVILDKYKSNKPIGPNSKLTRRLPIVKSTNEALKYLNTVWPEYFNGENVVLDEKLYNASKIYLEKYAQSTEGYRTDSIMAKPAKYINDIYKWDSDFMQNLNNYVFTNISHAIKWLEFVKENKGSESHMIEPIYYKLNLSFAFNAKPFIFQNKNNKKYIIQNAMIKDPAETEYHEPLDTHVLRIFSICNNWRTLGYNSGYKTEPLDVIFLDNEIPIVKMIETYSTIIYAINLSGELEVYSDSTLDRADNPFQILCYNPASDTPRYAAMLPIDTGSVVDGSNVYLN